MSVCVGGGGGNCMRQRETEKHTDRQKLIHDVEGYRLVIQVEKDKRKAKQRKTDLQTDSLQTG